jgi:hypothetical protein
MLTLEELSQLVGSLTKSEKRYVALFCRLQGGDKAYWQLYRWLEGHPGAVEAVRGAFAARYPAALLEPTRKHLGKVLLKALRSFRAEKSVRSRLLALIEEVEVLFEKGLVAAGLARLEKGKELALRYEQFMIYLLLARLELQYLTGLEFAQVDEADLVSRQEKINGLLLHQLFINKHASLYEILLHRYFHRGPTRSLRENQRLNDLLLEEHQVSTTKRYASFESSKLHLLFQSTYFLMTGHYEESLKLFGDLSRLFDQHKSLWADQPLYYTYLVSGIVTGLKTIHQYETMSKFLKELETTSEAFGGQWGQMKQLVVGHRLSLHLELGQFSEGAALLKNYEEKEASTGETGPSHSQAVLGFYAASLYFGLGQFSPALRYVHTVLNTSSGYLSPQWYSLCRLLHLLIHLELGNTDFLEYEIRSVERKLKLQKKLFGTEKALLRFFRQYLKGAWQPQLLPDLLGQLESLAQDPFERQFLQGFDFISWAEAKVRKVPFAQVVREKVSTVIL